MNILAAEAPSGHEAVSLCGSSFCTINYQTLISSAIAIVITIVFGLWVAAKVKNDRPNKVQLLFELFLDYVRNLVGDTVSREGTDFIVPLAATIGFYILVANWLDFIPLPKPWFYPANADLNQTLAMAIVVFVISQGYAIRVRGVGGYLRHFLRPPFPPLTIIEELVKPVTLSLRLFGNIFAGVLMVYLLTLLPAVIAWVPVVVWKFFDVFFVGTIQAFIFMLLTIIYFSQAREGLEDEHVGSIGASPVTADAQGAPMPATTH